EEEADVLIVYVDGRYIGKSVPVEIAGGNRLRAWIAAFDASIIEGIIGLALKCPIAIAQQYSNRAAAGSGTQVQVRNHQSRIPDPYYHIQAAVEIEVSDD